MLIVPLRDMLDRRPLITTVVLCATVALVLCAVAPSFGVLLGTIAALGVTTVGGQILVPLAGRPATQPSFGEAAVEAPPLRFGTKRSSEPRGRSMDPAVDLSSTPTRDKDGGGTGCSWYWDRVGCGCGGDASIGW
jgi:hypothetical protein